MNQNQLLFELIRIAIGTQTELSGVPTVGDWKRVYSLAEKQSILGVCFVGVQRLQTSDIYDDTTEEERTAYWKMPETLYLRWMSNAGMIQGKNGIVDRRCAEIQKIVGDAEFRSFVMKGQGNAYLYGDLGEFRQSGDIDIYLEGGFEKIAGFVKKTVPSFQYDGKEIQYPCFSDVKVELHHKPIFLFDRRRDKILQEFFGEEMDECLGNAVLLAGMPVRVSTPLFNAVHQMVHVWLHFLAQGVGLRQLMDYYFVLKSMPEDVAEKAKVVETVDRIGLTAFARAVMWVMGEVFDMEDRYMLWTPSAEDGKVLLDGVMEKGNFGKRSDDPLMSHPAWQRFFIKIGRAWRYRRFGRWAWIQIPVYSVRINVWKVWKRVVG